MSRFLRIGFLIISYCSLHSIFSQDVVLNPVASPDLFTGYKEFVNPAYKKKNEYIYVGLNRSSYTGIRKIFHADFVSLQYNLNERHTFSGLVISEKIGQWINNTGALLGYGNHLYLNDSLLFSAGIQLGFHQTGVAPNSTGFGGTDIVTNARVGLYLQSPVFEFGVSFHEFLKREILIIEEPQKLPHNLNVYGSYTISARGDLDINIGGLFRFIQSEELQYKPFLLVYFLKKIGAGFILKNTNSVMGIVELKKLPLYTGKLSVFLGYESYFRSEISELSSSKYSLGIAYGF